MRAQGTRADPLAVVQAHVAAVRTGDPVLMAADYSPDARIARTGSLHVPLDFFRRAVARLNTSELVVSTLERGASTGTPGGTARATITMQWQLRGGAADGTRGTDTFSVQGDRIVAQQVVLHTADY